MAHKALWPLALASVWLIAAGYMLRQNASEDGAPSGAVVERAAPVPEAPEPSRTPPAPRPLVVEEDAVQTQVDAPPPPRPGPDTQAGTPAADPPPQTQTQPQAPVPAPAKGQAAPAAMPFVTYGPRAVVRLTPAGEAMNGIIRLRIAAQIESEGTQPYFGAYGVDPLGQIIARAAGHASLDAAIAALGAQCETRSACVVFAHILPQPYDGLTTGTLNARQAEIWQAFRNRTIGTVQTRPTAFAWSPDGAAGTGRGHDAALAACADDRAALGLGPATPATACRPYP